MPETTGTQAHPHTLEAQASGIPVVLCRPNPEQATEVAKWQVNSTVMVNPKITWYDGDMIELQMPSETISYGPRPVSDFPGIKAFAPVNDSTEESGDTEPVEVTKLFCHELISEGIRKSLKGKGVEVEEFSTWEELKSHIEHI
ncbi:uncharacterized protein FPRO_14794 [Fusarium proliferatum ET1]|uniref:Uncharacterized protein n=1 Tax=Fusarium proliferatum (strain ET1) TaxID=1227346 RepID=A0A1L7WAS4_FUSPR|nr:uncharacterized protein FPRO_14794 [Fusarium proliferatum ET1]CZR49729.1 uncharacterized protein FPRO_14794 [Fusarium proliferatum ET1]